jgi:hypothetical protein
MPSASPRSASRSDARVPPPDPRLAPAVEELSPLEQALVRALVRIIARDLVEERAPESSAPIREPREAREW